MHDLKQIENDVEKFKHELGRRKVDNSILTEILSLSEKRKKLIVKAEDNRALVKSLSKEIGPLKKKGEDASELMEKVAAAKVIISETEKALDEIVTEQNDLLLTIPNILFSEVPDGKDEEDNKLIESYGEKTKLDFKPKDHVELGENLKMLDFETAAKTTGSRFVFYRGDLARLERALINYMIDQHLDHGYEEVLCPFIVHERSLVGTGQLPKFKEDLFKLEGTDWYLIPTAEVPLTNIKRDELFSKDELPLKFCGFSPSFRSEAGSYGKDTRGLIRLHQFQKVELVNIVGAHESEKAHMDMVERAKSILRNLNLPFRSMLLCSGDTGFGARKTIDIEVWLPAQNKYREISSISNCGDFQARRAGIRFRGDDGKPEFAHTLNGSGLAVGRTVVAIMENYQQEDGSIKIPEVLVGYMGGKTEIRAK